MPRNDNAKQRLSISSSIMLPMEMTRTALRLIKGSDFLWEQADITAEPVRKGWDLKPLTYRYEDPIREKLRTVRVRGHYLGRDGLVKFESGCELHNYRFMWEPRFVDVKIGGTNRRFYYINEWQEDRYHSKIRE